MKDSCQLHLDSLASTETTNDNKTNLVKDSYQLQLDSLASTETMNDNENKSMLTSKSDLNDSAKTKENIVGEITLTEPENTTNDSKSNLTLEDMPLGVAGMHL